MGSSHPVERTEQLLRALQEHGYKATSQRAAICRVLVQESERNQHPTPYAVYEEVHREFPRISKATVYNTLTVLRSLGEITEIGLGQEETHYESDPSPHANLICLRCGRIVDIPDTRLVQMRDDLAAQHGFAVKAARADIYGYCLECRRLEIGE